MGCSNNPKSTTEYTVYATYNEASPKNNFFDQECLTKLVKKYYIGEETPRIKNKLPARRNVILEYRSILDEEEWREEQLHIQFFIVMAAAYFKKEYITKLEMIAAMRKGFSDQRQQPTAAELNSVNTTAYKFRKVFGPEHRLVAYDQRVKIEGYGIQWVYLPITTIEQYMRIVGNHIQNTIDGLTRMQDENLITLRLFEQDKRKANKRIRDLLRELRLKRRMLEIKNTYREPTDVEDILKGKSYRDVHQFTNKTKK